MTDLAQTIAPKSDQLNADDLIAGPMTITVTRVAAAASEQPIAIYYEDDGGKPYKPCKSMRRVLVQVWGRDGAAYARRRMTLYRDPTVTFGSQQVGGIRISHMSHIDKPVTMALTATRAKRAPFTVKPLEAGAAAPQAPTPHSESSPTVPPHVGDDAAGAPSPPPSGAPAFVFALIDSKGAERRTDDGAQWADALVSLITQKPFDVAQRIFDQNKEHIKAAYEAGHAQHARRVELAMRTRDPA